MNVIYISHNKYSSFIDDQAIGCIYEALDNASIKYHTVFKQDNRSLITSLLIYTNADTNNVIELLKQADIFIYNKEYGHFPITPIKQNWE